MINQIVKIRNGNNYRILDKINVENNTLYLSLDLNNNIITTIEPKHIIDIIDIDINNSYYSKIDIIKNNGLF